MFENTAATDVEDGSPCEVETERGTVTADSVVVATNVPVFDRARYYERLYPKRSYVLAVRLEEELPEGMYYEPTEPYFSVRSHPAGDDELALVGGQNHRTGHGDGTTERYRSLERRASERLSVDSVEYRWSTQDFVSVDGVPFVGRLGPQSDNVYVATGFGGWGMTNGVAAGLVLSELILDGESQWDDVYRPLRFDAEAADPAFGHHNEHDVKHAVEDFDGLPRDESVDDVEPGQGTVVELDEGPTAVYRDDDGDAHAVSAVCTHMGCLVHWNDGERSWDCPCHGSRFDVDGSVLHGPANGALSERDSE